MLNFLNNYKTVSIIGMGKNVGKTTTLNYILKELYRKKRVALTSIGHDGETEDIITKSIKPRIYVEAGTIIATSKKCLNNSDITKSILETTNINTPLGEIIIIEALSDGFVDLAGPSFNSSLKDVIKKINKYNVDITLIDGAINRKASASSFISDATILATGAAYAKNMTTVLEDTQKYVKVLNLKKVDDKTIEKFARDLIKKYSVTIINKDLSIKNINIKTALKSSKEIIDKIDKNSHYLIINGALSNELLTSLIENRKLYKELKIILSDGTKCFFDKEIFEKLKRYNIEIMVLDKTKLLCVTYNPTSPYGYFFNNDDFKRALEYYCKLPIINVMEVLDEKFYQ